MQHACTWSLMHAAMWRVSMVCMRAGVKSYPCTRVVCMHLKSCDAVFMSSATCMGVSNVSFCRARPSGEMSGMACMGVVGRQDLGCVIAYRSARRESPLVHVRQLCQNGPSPLSPKAQQMSCSVSHIVCSPPKKRGGSGRAAPLALPSPFPDASASAAAEEIRGAALAKSDGVCEGGGGRTRSAHGAFSPRTRAWARAPQRALALPAAHTCRQACTRACW